MSENGLKNIVKLSFKEEVANAITHGVMCLLTLFLIPVTAVYGYIKYGLIGSAGISIFMISIFLMFTVSCLYHTMAYDTEYKIVFRILDHIFIYFAIAGTYTPIALYLIQGWEGALILIIQWLMVLFGILYKSLAKKSMPKLSLTIYLVMGWTAVLFFPRLLEACSNIFLFFIILGGILYSAGAYFYTKKSMKYHHMIWHLFINAASIAHFIAIIFFM